MYNPRNRTISEVIYGDIISDDYLLELYSDLLKAYTRKLFNRNTVQFDEKRLNDLLRFADILSKSDESSQSGIHKIWSQQIIALLDKLYPNNYKIKFYMHSILLACNNIQGIKIDKFIVENESVFDELIDLSDREYFKVPNTENEFFFEDQKSIFDGFAHQYFSYSAPTSMGKSYVMRVFIKQQIIAGSTSNFAIIVPTKALINEVRSKILSSLGKDLMSQHDYKVVTSANDMLLEQEHHFIFIMTPERFLYLMNTTDKTVEYLFIDEAHKISTKDARSPFYYEMVDKISATDAKPHIIFSSPNIPNPEVYLSLIPDENDKQRKQAVYSPVCQMKYLINLKDGLVKAYNDYSKQFIKMGNASTSLTLPRLINMVSSKPEQNIIYCGSIRETLELAVEYANTVGYVQTPDKKVRLEAISKDIKNQINSDYYLVDLIKKGIAFHVGYLPASIRKQIEDAFRDRIITTLFCTSTLIEGVNLPADNLFITSHKNGQHNLDDVSFRNLIGRVGRIDHSLFGNVFMVCLPHADHKTPEKYEKLLTEDISDQHLSIEKGLSTSQKKAIITSLVSNDFEMRTKPEATTADEFSFMRKQALIFVNDLKSGKQSCIVQALKPFASTDDIQRILQNAQNNPITKGLDVSPDQIISLSQFVSNGNEYPPLRNNEIDYNDVVEFLLSLSSVFKWRIYEKKTLGYGNEPRVNNARISMYANLLYRWMSGYGLSTIILAAIQYKEKHPETGIWSNNQKIEDYYNRNDPRHKNLVISDTLNIIENVILFSIANYFREFSTEYKRQHDNKPFDNDWYEYVEFGTTNQLTIVLQRYGFSREASSYIIKHEQDFVDRSNPSPAFPFMLRKQALLDCDDSNVVTETPDIYINVPELFVE